MLVYYNVLLHGCFDKWDSGETGGLDSWVRGFAFADGREVTRVYTGPGKRNAESARAGVLG